MKKSLCCLLALLLLLPALCAAGESAPRDYAGELTLNPYSDTVKTAVTVKTFVDGDTTHFLVPETVHPSGVLKARYLAVNTPEITGKIEEYGKKAAEFTREKLESAVSILIESDDGRWNLDSTGERVLAWVWYQPAENAAYRCLNVELLQNGLALPNSAANNRYGSFCTEAAKQARAQKLYVFSGQRDPDFYYGDAIELTLREIRCAPEQYVGKKVAFTGVVTMNDENSVYMEAFDAETGILFGMAVYYGYGLNGAGLDVLRVGNESRIVGTLQYYEAGGTYQVSGLTYRLMKPKDPGNIQKISDGHAPAYPVISAEDFAHGVVTLAVEGESKTLPLAALMMNATAEIKNLAVLSAVSSASGAVTLNCEADGANIRVFSALPLPDITGKTVDVRGIVDYFDGAYQIKVLTENGITLHP